MQILYNLRKPAIVSYLHIVLIAGLVIWCSVKTGRDIVSYRPTPKKSSGEHFSSLEEKILKKAVVFRSRKTDDAKEKPKEKNENRASVVRKTEDEFRTAKQQKSTVETPAVHKEKAVHEDTVKHPEPHLDSEKQDPEEVRSEESSIKDQEHVEKNQSEDESDSNLQELPKDTPEKPVTRDSGKDNQRVSEESTGDSSNHGFEGVLIEGEAHDYGFVGGDAIDFGFDDE
ncbi:hypothetical protein BEWA_011510 [Theileria equi strain WA]|uniref:Uncharacterized protein n=1 Tax=Theileria equi strain WA TaxID=1537102 RepID=L0B2L8_THEEQ|nr:hypothetical protein BEWA_011510 [Theileria equi strain WA]AFZ81733.1 hypothetical protein BEWA_011510 [Theileria equi strain WA]|eukprot:XP_004831399.1 hypothetical protein BEWA_011510 [Theileria equi strain WA]